MIFPDDRFGRKFAHVGLIVVSIIILIRVFFFSWYTDSSGFMYPTFADKKIRFVYSASKFNRGDIVLAQFSNQSKHFFRVVGIPGDHVSYVQNRIVLNGQFVPSKISPMAEEIIKNYNGILYPGSTKESLLANQETLDGISYNVLTFDLGAKIISEDKIVPQDSYYLIQDNRIISSDSRYYGPISKDQIIGKIF